MNSSASVSSCSSNSGEISSAKPVKVHTCHNPFPGRGTGKVRTVCAVIPRASFMNANRLACMGRLVDPRYYRERFASFLDVYGRLAAFSHGLDEVPDLVAVRHGEAAWIRARPCTRPGRAIPFHHLLRLVFASACAIRVSLLSLAGGVEVPELVVVDDGGPPIPVHGDPGGKAWIGRRRRHDGAEGAAGELQDGYRGIFDLDPLVGEQTCVRGDLDDRAHQPLQQVDTMDGLVDQDSPTVQRPCAPPAARVVVLLRPPPPHLSRPRCQPPEIVVAYRFLHRARGRVEAVLADDGDFPCRCALHLEQTVRRFKRYVNGLLDYHVLACLERRYGIVRVHAARGAHANCVYVCSRQHFLQAGVPGTLILTGQLLGQLGDDVGHRHKLRAVEARDGARVVGTDYAATQYPETQPLDRRHLFSPPSAI